MDKKEILKALQAQVLQIQQELDNEKDGVVEKYPAMLSEGGCIYLQATKFIPEETGVFYDAEVDCNAFPDYDTAEKYAEAFKVMLELRRCEGAGHYSDGEGWGFSCDECDPEGGITYYSKGDHNLFSFFPPFPTEELAEAAMKKVGKDRIIASIKFLANIKEE